MEIAETPPEAVAENKVTERIKLSKLWHREEGFWIVSVEQVNLLLSYMQIAVDIARNQEFTTGRAFADGEQEYDAGYMSFVFLRDVSLL